MADPITREQRAELMRMGEGRRDRLYAAASRIAAREVPRQTRDGEDQILRDCIDLAIRLDRELEARLRGEEG